MIKQILRFISKRNIYSDIKRKLFICLQKVILLDIQKTHLVFENMSQKTYSFPKRIFFMTYNAVTPTFAAVTAAQRV